MRFFLTTFCLLLLLFSNVVSAKIVYSLIDDGIVGKNPNGVYVMDDNGKNITLLADTRGALSARWSPDGKHILFSRWQVPYKPQGKHIFLINADGDNIRQLTGLNDVFTDIYPSFLPHGKSILFVRNNKGARVMDLESGEIRKIGDSLLIKPDLSPDGKYIVYTEYVPNVLKKVSNIWIMNADGSNRSPLLPSAHRDGLIIDRRIPRWARYGKRIVYMECRYKAEKFGPATVAMPQGFHYFIYDLNTRELRELDGIPKELKASSIDWMDNDKSLVFGACKILRLLERNIINVCSTYNFYKYHIGTGEIMQLADHLLGKPVSVDWIRDDAHAVSPIEKLTTQWGELKRK